MTTTIKLDTPITLPTGTVTEIRLKEPTGQQFIDVGEPTQRVWAGGEAGYVVELQEKIKLYLERCIDHELGAALIASMSFKDARKVKNALLDFFRAA